MSLTNLYNSLYYIQQLIEISPYLPMTMPQACSKWYLRHQNNVGICETAVYSRYSNFVSTSCFLQH